MYYNKDYAMWPPSFERVKTNSIFRPQMKQVNETPESETSAKGPLPPLLHRGEWLPREGQC
jgi:hypothetical protein